MGGQFVCGEAILNGRRDGVLGRFGLGEINVVIQQIAEQIAGEMAFAQQDDTAWADAEYGEGALCFARGMRVTQ